MTLTSDPNHSSADVQVVYLVDEGACSEVNHNLQQPRNETAETDDHESDDMTIIGLDHDPESGTRTERSPALSWIEQEGPAMEERRRDVLLQELQRVQRASFVHFILLCFIPTALVVIVFVTVLEDNEECASNATVCWEETASILNAFTTRCICEAIDVKGDGN